MKRSILAVLLSFLVVVAGCRSMSPSTSKAQSDRIVVLLSVDGLAGFYLDDPKAEMPTIRQLATEGARASSMKAVAPSVTWPNHVTLVTGDMPARHGVVGNNFLDRQTLKPVVLIGDPVFDKQQIVKVPTVYDLAKRAGLVTAAIYWPCSRNADTLDWNLPTVSTARLLERYTTPSLISEFKSEGLWPKMDPKDPEARVRVSDEDATKGFVELLKKHRPNLALLHVSNVDHMQHLNGPRTPAAYAAIKSADDQVRQVWDELQKDFTGKATLIVVSDHGFSPIDHLLLPNVVLQKAGLIAVKDNRVVGGAVRVVVQGGAAMVYVTDVTRRSEVIAQVKQAFSGLNGMEKVISSDEFGPYGVADPKVDPHAPDLILFANEGWAFGDTGAGALPVIEKSEPSGTHGHDPNIPDLHATFVAWGAGIKSGTTLGEIPNTDVAPTVAKLLGIPMSGTDGRALDEILTR